MVTDRRPPRLAVWKFASCDGCQLTLLDCEDDLLAIAGQVEVAYFLEATSASLDGPYDLSLVEGSITTPEDAERIQRVRASSRSLVTIGACATAGGIQALRNAADIDEYLSIVYAHPEYISTLADSTAIAAHVPVDFELRGCPIDKGQLVEVISAFLARRRPEVPAHSVCVDCKLAGNVCVMVAHGTPCLGPATHAGCGALCPSYNRGCYGCFGPAEDPNPASLTVELGRLGADDAGIVRLLRTFNAAAPAFAEESAPARRREGAPAMTHKATGSRTLAVGALARVEGEGALHVDIRDGELHDVQLRIYEPPRFFEAFLRGRSYVEPPDITARICGICPVAYQMSACAAIEAACGVTVDGPLADLRRLLYFGEWIESHSLHVHLLHAPDFLGYESAIAMAEHHRPAVERGLALKKTGNALVELVGGRAIHPVNIRVGGFHRAPKARELGAFVPELEAARDRAEAVVDWVAGFDFPDLDGDWELAALRHPGAYAITRGRLVTSGGLDLDESDFADVLVEDHVERSTALRGGLRGRGHHLTGPLARFALNAGELSRGARSAAVRVGLDDSNRNPYRSIVVRAVEVLHACEEALAVIARYEEPDAPAVPVEPVAGVGCGWTEAPRGTLWHRYELDADGTILDARIVPPTSQNQAAIEDDLTRFVADHLDLDDHDLAHGAESIIRNHDPCISCATHFLDLTVDRR